MKVQSASRQEGVQVEAARSEETMARPSRAPVVFDASGGGPSEGLNRARGARPIELPPLTNHPPIGVPAHYASKPAGQSSGETNHQGVYKDDGGGTFIRQGNQTYPVKYDKDNGTWRVYSPDNPTKYPYPVKQDKSGDWHVHSAVGLRGGGGYDAGRFDLAGVRQATQARVAQLEHQAQQLEVQLQLQMNQIAQFPGPQGANLPAADVERQRGMLIDTLNEGVRLWNDQLREINQLQAELAQMEPGI